MKLKEPSMSLNLPSSARVARFWFLLAIGILVFHITTAGNAAASDKVEVQWNVSALQGVPESRIGPPMVAPAPANVYTWIYTTSAAYRKTALSVRITDSLERR